MNNLSNSLKKFLGNKNTVTIIGVILCVVILWIGYNIRINQKVALTKVPVANQTIQPRKKITQNMIGTALLPAAFLKGSAYYSDPKEILGMYSNYNTVIAEGSLFYKDLLIEEKKLPNSSFINIKDGYTVINYRVNMDTTYANSMMPGDKINIYFKGTNDDDTIMFGKFISNVEILDVKDSSGQHVFEDTTEARTPAYMLFALPEDMHLLFRKALYLSGQFGVELILVPNTQELSPGEDEVMVSSEDIQKFINDKTKMVSVDEILSSTKEVSENKETTDDTTNKTNDKTKKSSNKSTTNQ